MNYAYVVTSDFIETRYEYTIQHPLNWYTGSTFLIGSDHFVFFSFSA